MESRPLSLTVKSTNPIEDKISGLALFSPTMLIFVLLTLFGCGTASRLNTRIINGVPMAPNEFPFLAIIDFTNGHNWYHLCGAVLVAPNKVLTAAHCVSDDLQHLRVVFGEHSLNAIEGTEQHRSIQSIVKHPGYGGNDPGYPNDLAMVTLTQNADTSGPAVSTIPLATPGSVHDGDQCVMAGWGSQATGSIVVHTTPAKATVDVISHSLCEQLWSTVTGQTILPGHVCTFGPAQHSACHYDFGGPLICNGTLGGIMSWGDISCGSLHPSVMSSVPFYHNWIQQQLFG